MSLIVSASRRTDIPAFYAEWFMSRIHEQYCTVPNPFNRNQVSRVSLKPEDVDAIVFWTKNATPLSPHLNRLNQLGERLNGIQEVAGSIPTTSTTEITRLRSISLRSLFSCFHYLNNVFCTALFSHNIVYLVISIIRVRRRHSPHPHPSTELEQVVRRCRTAMPASSPCRR